MQLWATLRRMLHGRKSEDELQAVILHQQKMMRYLEEEVARLESQVQNQAEEIVRLRGEAEQANAELAQHLRAVHLHVSRHSSLARETVS